MDQPPLPHDLTRPETIRRLYEMLQTARGLGIASVALGVLACLTCWIPFVWVLSILFGVIGLLVSAVGLAVSIQGKKTGIGMPVAGLAACVIAILIAVVSTAGTSTAINQAVHAANRKAPVTNQEAGRPARLGRQPPPVTPANSSPRGARDESWASAKSPVKPAGDGQVMRPLLERPRSLDGLYKRLEGKQVATGFIGKPIRVGVSGMTESVFVERVVDKTNMLARIRFPELRNIEMAPGWYHPGMDMRFIQLPTPMAWQTGDYRVWISGIDTTGVVDNMLIYLAEPIEVVDTVQTGGKTIYRVVRE